MQGASGDVDRVLVSLASHHVAVSSSAGESWDEERVWRECMAEWSGAHAEFAEEEYAAWELLRRAELGVSQGRLVAGLAAECVSLIERELDELERKVVSSATRVEAAAGAVEDLK